MGTIWFKIHKINIKDTGCVNYSVQHTFVGVDRLNVYFIGQGKMLWEAGVRNFYYNSYSCLIMFPEDLDYDLTPFRKVAQLEYHAPDDFAVNDFIYYSISSSGPCLRLRNRLDIILPPVNFIPDIAKAITEHVNMHPIRTHQWIGTRYWDYDKSYQENMKNILMGYW